MPVDPDGVIDDFQARVDERTQQALRLSAELERAEVTLRSSRREITVREAYASRYPSLDDESEGPPDGN